MTKLHLDSMYRNRWEEFHLIDGTVEDSREKNWREVAWDKVASIEVHVLGKVHKVDNSNPAFLAFMNFRWAGQEAKYSKEGLYIGHAPIKIWTVGWTDGKLCYLKDVDFCTGNLVREYTANLSRYKGHIHPIVKDKVLDNGNNLES